MQNTHKAIVYWLAARVAQSKNAGKISVKTEMSDDVKLQLNSTQSIEK